MFINLTIYFDGKRRNVNVSLTTTFLELSAICKHIFGLPQEYFTEIDGYKRDYVYIEYIGMKRFQSLPYNAMDPISKYITNDTDLNLIQII